MPNFKMRPNFQMRYVLLALVPLAVVGCVSTEEQRSMDQEKCASFGYAQGTDGFANCMMKQSSQRDDDDQRFLDRMDAQDRNRKEARRHQRDSAIDTRPSYDKDGNPNFDTQGNYQGCNGVGCLVDNPDDSDG